MIAKPWPARIACGELAPHGLCFAAGEATALIVRLTRLERYARDAYRTCALAPVPTAP